MSRAEAIMSCQKQPINVIEKTRRAIMGERKIIFHNRTIAPFVVLVDDNCGLQLNRAVHKHEVRDPQGIAHIGNEFVWEKNNSSNEPQTVVIYPGRSEINVKQHRNKVWVLRKECDKYHLVWKNRSILSDQVIHLMDKHLGYSLCVLDNLPT